MFALLLMSVGVLALIAVGVIEAKVRTTKVLSAVKDLTRQVTTSSEELVTLLHRAKVNKDTLWTRLDDLTRRMNDSSGHRDEKKETTQVCKCATKGCPPEYADSTTEAEWDDDAVVIDGEEEEEEAT